ncbi:scavenger receptor cysteine-rich type 1 protein M130-like [Mercenaria mercenaria]|uniref:scavenger receptor cysteine-rich type 1 protein M130-like n=1 Tax=Mercenaria mercenaria TaxID=6596 RepID=UPI00234E6844|nr:scavenger receptor cysteine-rich type 1 protein M130-like [Mercenaria mercenaria]
MEFSDLNGQSVSARTGEGVVNSRTNKAYENTSIISGNIILQNDLDSGIYETLRRSVAPNEVIHGPSSITDETAITEKVPIRVELRKYCGKYFHLILIGALYITVFIAIIVFATTKTKVNGNWTEWSFWSSCDVTCHKGVKMRIRSCTNPSSLNGGLKCDGNNTEIVDCQNAPCLDGGWSVWSRWGSCSSTCGGGIRSRSRTCSNPKPSLVGRFCDGNPTQTSACSQTQCPVSNDIWSRWSSWSACSAQCEKKRTRACSKRSTLGKTCTGNSMERVNCDLVSCSFIPLYIRLAGGSSARRGRVEISLDRLAWGTVCNDLFTTAGAQVVCRMLGYPTSHARIISVSAGTGTIYLDNVICTGLERSLVFCKHNSWGQNNCHHHEDIGVSC